MQHLPLLKTTYQATRAGQTHHHPVQENAHRPLPATSYSARTGVHVRKKHWPSCATLRKPRRLVVSTVGRWRRRLRVGARIHCTEAGGVERGHVVVLPADTKPRTPHCCSVTQVFFSVCHKLSHRHRARTKQTQPGDANGSSGGQALVISRTGVLPSGDSSYTQKGSTVPVTPIQTCSAAIQPTTLTPSHLRTTRSINKKTRPSVHRPNTKNKPAEDVQRAVHDHPVVGV